MYIDDDDNYVTKNEGCMLVIVLLICFLFLLFLFPTGEVSQGNLFLIC